MHPLPFLSCSNSMNPLVVLSMAVAAANTMILILASTTLCVHALQLAPLETMTHRSRPCRSIFLESHYSPPSSKLFGTLHHTRRRKFFSMLHSTGDENINDMHAVDAEVVNQPSSASSPSTSSSFLQALDNFGMKLKPWALSAHRKSLTYSKELSVVNGNDGAVIATSKVKSLLCKLQADILWMLYILYRGYRGFFVILPAVFREVYRKLEKSGLVVDVYGDEEIEEKEYAVNSNAGGNMQPRQLREPMRLRTRITISMLSGMLTLSYVVSGALSVLGELLYYWALFILTSTFTKKQPTFSVPRTHTGKFIKTFTNTTSVESSFEAAAEEVVVNENRLREKMKWLCWEMILCWPPKTMLGTLVEKMLMND